MAGPNYKAATAHDARIGSTLGYVPAPAADEGVRNALRGAFACAKETPDDFDRLLARLR